MMRKKTISNPLSGRVRRPSPGGSFPPNALTKQAVVTLVGVVCCLLLLGTVFEFHHSTSSSDVLQTLERVNSNNNNSNMGANAASAADDDPSRLDTVASIRAEFYRRYGGKEASEHLLPRGIHAYGSVHATARRLLTMAATGEPFVLSFAGYSVTVGRGNYYQQSYPFVLGRILEPLLKRALQLPVTVRNAAIGGIPSYPYAFCLEHFLGSDTSVMSWDFSMNEGRGAAVLESYLRHSQHQLPNHPMMILLDTNPQRCSLVEDYTKQGLLADAMCVGLAKDAVEDVSMLDLPDEQKAPGFRQWQEFGAPPNCPGRGNWHPKRMEHELLGWMIAMYFVQAVEQAQQVAAADPTWRKTYKALSQESAIKQSAVTFPRPLSTPLPLNDQHVTNLLFGHPTSDSNANSNVFTMKELSCRTNFLPATDHDKVLPSIVVSGLSPGITANNIMEERSDEAYAAGWVLDVSHVERDTKIKVEKCGGLGYVDLKTALYGIPASGILRLWLPSEGTHHNHENHGATEDATHWFTELIICEANEKREKKACNLDTDLSYTVGGKLVEAPTMIAGAAEYLKRKTCVHVGIPPEAKITRLRDVRLTDGTPVSATERRHLARRYGERGGGDKNKKDDDHPLLPDDHVGLIVDLQAKQYVTREHGACCVSHVVWEQQ